MNAEERGLPETDQSYIRPPSCCTVSADDIINRLEGRLAAVHALAIAGVRIARIGHPVSAEATKAPPSAAIDAYRKDMSLVVIIQTICDVCDGVKPGRETDSLVCTKCGRPAGPGESLVVRADGRLEHVGACRH